MSTGTYAPLHVHTEHSALDGLARLDLLADACLDRGITAAAVSDHGSLAGLWRWAQICSARGIKPIPAMEAYMAIGSRHERNSVEELADAGMSDADDSTDAAKKTKRYHHLSLLARNRTGWHNLIRFHNEAQKTVWFKPRGDFELLEECGEGLIVLTGCLASPVCSPLKQMDQADEAEQDRLWDQACQALEAIIAAVGAENVYIEVMDHGIEAEEAVLGWLTALAEQYELPMVATGDSHYIDAEDAEAHEAFLAVGTSSVLADEKRFRFNGSGYHLKTYQQMVSAYDDDWWTEAVDNTTLVSERVEVDTVPGMQMRLPRFPVEDSVSQLRGMVEAGAAQRYGEDWAEDEDLVARIDHELEIIVSMGFADYFLITEDMVSWARSTDGPNGQKDAKRPITVGLGRGSAAGSAVSYCLGIVGVDPIGADLLFERFLEPGREGMPDIDIDFPASRRDEVFEYLQTRWGTNYTARIGSPTVARSKAAIKDAARVLKPHDATLNRQVYLLGEKMAKAVPEESSGPLSFARIDDDAQRAREYFDIVNGDDTVIDHHGEDRCAAELIDAYARAFEDITKSPGIHPCGFVISDEPLDDLIPIRQAKEGPQISCFDGEDLEEMGFLKMDILGLENLDYLSTALENIAATTGKRISLDDIPDPDDEDSPEAFEAFELLQQGKTSGVFQIESSGATSLTRELSPEYMEDLSALIALYRPGPMGADMHHSYAARKNGEEEVSYHTLTDDEEEAAELDAVLGVTYGLCVAQDELVYSVSRGCLIPIREVCSGEVVQGVNERGAAAEGTVTRVMDNGEKPVVQASFEGGFTLRCTADHRLLTPDGWQPLSDIKPGDPVAVPQRLIAPRAPVTDHSLDRARILGYLIANGSLGTKTTVTFTTAEETVLNAMRKSMEVAFPSCSFCVAERENGIAQVFMGNGRGNGGPAGPLLNWMREIGFKDRDYHLGGITSGEKFIPREWMNATDEVVAALLAALWDCDGHIPIDSGHQAVRYKTVSPILAEQLRALLLRLGMRSTVYTSTYVNANGEKHRAYDVLVGSPKLFGELIGPYLCHEEKGARAEMLSDPTPRFSSIPRAKLKEAIFGAGWASLRAFSAVSGISKGVVTGDGHVTQYSAERVLAFTGDSELESLLNNRWVRLNQVVDSGTDRAFDLEVSDIHSFIASGIVVHNCVYQEQVMQLGTVVAGFDDHHRSVLRKAIGKKKQDLMDQAKAWWDDGAVVEHRDDSGELISPAFSHKTSGRLWDFIKASSEYIFNKSHSYAYGMTAYYTAYLKAQYPAEYAAAVLTHAKKDEKRLATLNSLTDEGIVVAAPDINASQVSTAAKDGTVYYGLAEIKGVGKAAAAIVEQRGQGYDSLEGLREVRVNGRKITKNQLLGLADAGALDCLGDRHQIRVRLEPKTPADSPIGRAAGQLRVMGIILDDNPLDLLGEDALGGIGASVEDDAASESESLVTTYDYEGNPRHPAPLWALSAGPVQRLSTLAEAPATSLMALGLTTASRVFTTRRGQKMAVIELTDGRRRHEVTIFPSVAEQKGVDRIPAVGDLTVVSGRMKDEEADGLKILATWVWSLDDPLAQTTETDEELSELSGDQEGPDQEPSQHDLDEPKTQQTSGSGAPRPSMVTRAGAGAHGDSFMDM